MARLRSRKHREERPFALMSADLDGARVLAEIGEQEALLLASPARPIVLLARRRDAPVAPSVAPGLHELGVMLPYAPLHHLLLGDFAELGGGALVMTSGNVSDEPIAFQDEDALERLGPIADAFLAHDRPIHMRTDDSVARVTATVSPRDGTASSDRAPRPMLLRRSRGYVPASVQLPIAAPAHSSAAGPS